MRDDDTTRRDGTTGPAGLDALEERRLRALLSGAVQGLEPSEHALERLRNAVPARRTRRRRALVGAAAAVLLAGAAVPTALRMTGTAGSGGAGHPAVAGHGEVRGGKAGSSSDPHQNGSGAHARSTAPAGKGPGAGDGRGGPAPHPSGSSPDGAVAGPTTGGATAGTSGHQDRNHQLPPIGAVPGLPECTAGQLGVLGSAHAPGADGKVYGSFKVTNVSDRGCLASGRDTVTAAPAADPPPPTRNPVVSVVGHTAGDPASALLPDPSAESPAVVLQPNAAYEVRFAWVPSERSCPAGTADPSAKPAQGGSGAAGTAAGAGGPAAASDPLGTTGEPAPTGVEVSHTPAAGAPTTQATIPAACGGTVYRTGVIPLTTPSKP